jgi:hypothetical protein
VSSAAAPVANVSPGGINNGLGAGQIIASTGSTAAEIQADTMAALATLYAGGAPRAPAWIMHPLNALWIGGLTNVNGAPAFPGGGATLHGLPVIKSATVSPAEIILLDQDAVLLASDDAVSVDSSTEASLQLDSAPASPPTPLVSLWQQNLIGIKAEQFAYWMRAKDTAVVMITTVDFMPAANGLLRGRERDARGGTTPGSDRKTA